MRVCFGRVIFLVWLVPAPVAQNGAWAQGITVDGRLSPAQTLSGPNYAVEAGLGRQVGGNLFHSFGTFGLNRGETATFNGPSSVGNVIGRVTGGAASSINGRVSSTITGANLYLINPAGVVFGPNASVSVSGSFHASSADYLRMKDGSRFQATNPDASTLSAAPPEAFGFLSANPRQVAVDRSTLRAAQGGTLGVVGGPVTITGGTLSAPGGTVHVASAAGPGEVPVDPRAGPAPTVARSGNVQVANNSSILANDGNTGSVFIHAGDLSVSASFIQANSNGGPGPGGVISLRGDRTVTVRNGAGIATFANGTGRGPGINVSTAAGGAVTLDSASLSTDSPATGDGGVISISTGRLTLQNGARVLSNAASLGNGGAVNVAADSVLLDGVGTYLLSQTTGAGLAGPGSVPGPAGAGGKISLAGGRLTVRNGASLGADTFGTGVGGTISIAMTGDVVVTGGGAHILSSSNPGNAASRAAAAKGGDAGALTLSAGTLTLSRGGSVRSVAYASGNAGDVALTVAGPLTVDAANNASAVNGVSSEAYFNSSGNAGSVQVSAGSVSVLNGGFINSNARGTGAGGSVAVTTPGALLLDGANSEIGASALDAQSGNAGTVTVKAGSATVQNGAQIASANQGPGRGGDVTVSAGSVSVLNGGTINSNTQGIGAGGSVTVVTPGTLLIDGGGMTDTGITASALGTESGDAGTVKVSAGSALVQSRGQIASFNNGPGQGGSVSVNAGTLTLLRGGSVHNIAFASGNAGEVVLNVQGALTIDAADNARSPNGVSSEAYFNSSGNAGSVQVSAGSVSIRNGGFINSNTRGTGAGGSVSVTALGALLVDGVQSEIGASALGPQSADAGMVKVRADSIAVQGRAQIDSSTHSQGRGGSVTVNTGTLTLASGGSVNSVAYASGNGGDVTLSVLGAVTVDGARNSGPINGVSSEAAYQSTGSAGSVQVTAGSVSVLKGGMITSSTQGTGAGGSVVLTTPGALLLDGRNVAEGSVLDASALYNKAGNAGTIVVNAGSVTVQNTAQITSSNSGPGRGGSVTVNAGILTLSRGGSVRSTTYGSGNAGEVALKIIGPLTIDGTETRGFSSILSSEAATGSSGSAGAVQVNAGSVSVLNGGAISSSTSGTGAGGSVLVMMPGTLLLDGRGAAGPSLITAASLYERGGGAGTVTVNAGTATVQNGAQITSFTRSPGRGGDVTVKADALTLARGGSVNSETLASGDAGAVVLNIVGPFTIDGTKTGGVSAAVSSAAQPKSSGNAGSVQVGAGSISVLNGGVITSSSNGTGAGRTVVVTTPGALLLDGKDVAANSAIAATSGAQSGDAGTVTVSAGKATIQGAAQITSSTSGQGRGGGVTVNAGELTLARGGSVNSVTSASGNAGTVTLHVAGSLTIDAADSVGLPTNVSSAAQPNSTGSAGLVQVTAGAMSVLNGGTVTSSTSGLGAGGSVVVETPGALLLDGKGRGTSAILASSLGEKSGDAGTVMVNAGTVTVRNVAQIASSTSGSGRGGGVTVKADALTLAGEGSVNSVTSGSGNAGEVTLNIGGPLTIGAAGNARFLTGVSSAAQLGSSGSAGSVQVKAGSVSILDRGTITSNTSGTGAGGSVTVTTAGALLLDGRGGGTSSIAAASQGPQSGDAGTVTVSAGSVTVQGGAVINSGTNGPGRGGSVSVAASTGIQLSGAGPRISATSTGTGSAGSINVLAPQVILRNGAGISTSAQAANGGNITIGLGDLLYLQGSSITTSVNGALGNGGNITVDPRFVILDRSLIQANAVGGNGGNVLVRADQLVPSADSAITASSQRGVSGNILVAAQPLNLNGSLVVLAGDLRSAAALLREGCAVRGASPQSSLVMAGRGGQRQGLEAVLPALYFVGRPVRNGGDPAPAASAAPAHVSLSLSSRCG